MEITITIPDTVAEAIRAVCYVRAWTLKKLAAEIGSTAAHLSQIVNGHCAGSLEMRARVLQHMPKGVMFEDSKA